MPKFISERELKEIRRKISRVRGSAMLPVDSSPLERAKFTLCKHLITYMQEKQLSQREFARRLGVVESRVSEIMHYRIKKLTLDRLVKYYQMLDTDFEVKVA